MLWLFNLFEYFCNVVVVATRRQTKWARFHFESARRLRFSSLRQAKPEQVVHNNLEGLAAAPDLLVEKDRDILINGKCGAHITMLAN